MNNHAHDLSIDSLAAFGSAPKGHNSIPQSVAPLRLPSRRQSKASLNIMIAVVVLWLAPLTGQARTIYVSKTGSDSGTGLIDSPYRTVGRAHRASKKGDTILVSAGRYDERLILTNLVTMGSWGEGPVVVGPIPNQAPVISGITDLLLPYNPAAVWRVVHIPLPGMVTDDARPNPPGKVTTTWELVAGSVLIDSTGFARSAHFQGPGKHILRLTASDGELVSSTNWTVEFYPDPNPTCIREVSAGENVTNSPSILPVWIQMNGGYTDDCPQLPPATVQWIWVSGPAKVPFSNPNSTITSAQFKKYGQYFLRLIVIKGSEAKTNQIRVNIDLPPK